MAVSESTLTTCRTAILASAKLTTYRTAYDLYDSANSDDKGRYWNLCFSDAQAGQSPAMALKKEIREIVIMNTASNSASEREAAYRQLVSEYVGEPQKPLTADERQAIIEQLLLQTG